MPGEFVEPVPFMQRAVYGGVNQAVAALIPSGATRVLDLGCGDGSFGKWLKSNGVSSVTGVTVQGTEAELARRVLDEVIEADLDRWEPAEEQVFDGIVASHVLEHLSELVVKEVHGSGGKGMLVGPTSSKAEIEAFAGFVRARPDNYIAQPTLALSTCPTFVAQGIAPRHVDLRPCVLPGRKTTIIPGGLTRVALKEGSLVVNSSQGGGTKDTWVLAPEAGAGE